MTPVPRPMDEDDETIRLPNRQKPTSPDHSDNSRKRRRAATACKLCRTRKTKCDNGRPTCGYCKLQGVTCVYNDRPESDDSSFVSNSLLLDKINYLTKVVEELRDDGRNNPDGVDPVAGKSSATNLGVRAPQSTLSPASHRSDLELSSARATANTHDSPSSSVQNGINSAFSDDGFGRLEVSEIAARTSACESILRWTPLSDMYCGEPIQSFPLQAATQSEDARGSAFGSGSDQDIWPLCRRFLQMIHFKNPVLDVLEFKKTAREASEYGVGWDASSCLILLSCALACIATPYHESALPSPGSDKDKGEAYFMAAKRRMGLLPNSLISFQCQYFAGLYEKFAIRPLSAWMLFQQACVRFQAYLYAKALASESSKSEDQSRTRHVEQRLYWSCVKAECELRAELQFPASGLLQFKYPDLFPSLSFPTTSEQQEFADGWCGSLGHTPIETSPTPSSSGYLEPEEERSWLYYLAEISLRQIMNRILESLYSKGEAYWTRDMAGLLAHQAVLRESLILWREHLPPQIRFEDMGRPSNELSFFLKTRYLLCMEWMTRPFLFCFLNNTTTNSTVLTIARDCVDACAALIPIIAEHHRHGGIWGLLRRSFSCALLLIAFGVKNRAGVDMADIVTPVEMAINSIRSWEDGVPDLAWMRSILEKLLVIAYANGPNTVTHQ